MMFKKNTRVKKGKKEKGFAALEFALMLPVLLTILAAIIEYGWLFKTQIELNNAVSAAGNAVIKEEVLSEEEKIPKQIAVSAIHEALDESIESAVLNDVLSVITTHDDDPPPRAEIVISNLPYDPLTGMLPGNMLPGTISAKAVVAYP